MRTPVFLLIITMFLHVQSLAWGQISANLNKRYAPQIKHNQEEWQPSSFRGLIVGKSGRADMLRRLGKPTRKEYQNVQNRKHREVWYVYHNIGEFPGEFTIIVDDFSSRILTMILYPDNLSKVNAIKHFGSDYRLTTYDFCPGFDEAETAPVFESSPGNASYIEYRQRGIALFIGDKGEVNDIRYVAHSIGFASRRECQLALQKYRASLRKARR